MPAQTDHPANRSINQQAVCRAGQVLQNGGLVIFPTETVYGLAAAADSDPGYAALREFKGRPDAQPFTLHVADAATAGCYADLSSPLLQRLVRKVLPGPVTLVVDVSDAEIERRLAEMNLPATVKDRLYHQNTIGLRCPDHPLGQAFLAATPGPVVASSANRRGQAPPLEVREATQAVGAAAALALDGGPCRYAKPSTIVRIQGSGAAAKITVLRAGVYDERVIRKLLRWTMLLVCSGNTCRSPMAEGIARQMLAQERRLAPDELEAAGLRVLSAGVFASGGIPASAPAQETMRKMGVDLSRHRSRALAPEMVHEADVIYCMTESQRNAVLEFAPAAADKTQLLDAHGDIDDPIGASPEEYVRCAEQIRTGLSLRLQEQHP